MLRTSTTLPPGHDWIVKPMQSLGLRANLNGVCDGINHMAMQAILLEDIVPFNDRLFTIYQLKNTLATDLIKFKKRREEIYQKIILDNVELLEDDEQKAMTYTIIRKKIARFNKKYQEEENKLLDILIFFNGVELYFQPQNYRQVFKKDKAPSFQDGKKCTFLLAPEALKKQGGANQVEHFTGAYSYHELQSYFESLHKQLKEFPYPIALILSNNNHSVTVGYDPKKKCWIFVNPSQLPAQFIDSNLEIAKLVLSALSKSMVAAFTTEVYVAGNNAARFAGHLALWKSDKNWKAMHTLTPEKIHLTDSNGSNILYLAAKNGDIKLVKQLMGKTNIDHAINMGETALFIAAQNNHLTIVKLLLSQNAQVNKGRGDVTPLLIACQKGNHKIVEELIVHGASIKDVFAANPAILMQFAAQHGRKKELENLFRLKKINLKNKISGFSALHLAVFFGHVETVKVLLKYKAEKKSINIDALEFAKVMNHAEIVQLLENKMIEQNRTSKKSGPSFSNSSVLFPEAPKYQKTDNNHFTFQQKSIVSL